MVDTDFLNSLKVGDKVAVSKSGHATKTRYYIGTVTKITKTRQIEIDGTEPKFKDGRAKYSEWTSKYLYPLTEELKNEIHRDNLISKFQNMEWEKVSDDKLKAIEKVLGWKDRGL